MRHIYLIRHGEPEFANGVRCCIGRTDLPLSREGRRQAQRLGDYFAETPLTAVYCSTLTRAVQTAEGITRAGVPVYRVEALQELYSGLWEGLSFDQIREKYPEQYARRKINPEQFAPEQGERSADGILRFKAAVELVVNESIGDIAIVAHASVNRLYLCSLQQKCLNEVYSIQQPYGCINQIIEENGILRAGRIGFLPIELPDEEIIQSLWAQYHTSECIIAHCRAVAQKAMKLTREMADSGNALNGELIFSAAMLHDIARAEPDHSAQGAKWIAKAGYENVAELIAVHHDLNECECDPVTEKTVVFLADKLISGEREVTLEERFAASAAKCTDPGAKDAHEKKYKQAAAVLARVQRLIRKGETK